MTSVIKKLPEAIANQIAAGEVVQRPASALKELMENAVDAGADEIRVHLREAGKSLIQVIDNGCGMNAEDAELCFERHATSKIRSFEDLYHIRTNGFRGEAMPSIAAVSRFEMNTRPKGDATGVSILIEGGKLLKNETVACPEGTSISVKNLFFNVPARRNFLKSDGVEIRHLLDTFQRLALAHPEIFFSLSLNGQEQFHLRSGNLRQRIVGLFGKSFNEKLIPASEQTSVLDISGFIGKPAFARKTRGEQFFFVNRRFIRSPYLNHAVNKAFEELIPEKSFPFYVLFLEIDPARVDVNVHPTKTEVKFEDEKIIYTFVLAAIRHALASHNLTPSLDFDQDSGFTNLDAFIRPSGSGGQSGSGGSTGGGQAGSTGSTGANPGQPQTRRVISAASAGMPEKAASDLESRETAGQSAADANDAISAQSTSKFEGAAPWEKLFEGGETLRIESDFSGAETGELANGQLPGFGQKGEDVKPFQLHLRYILSPIRSGLLVLDQQSAHERVLYEKHLALLDSGTSSSQQQLFSKTVELPASDAVLLNEILPELNSLGFDIRDFGSNSFVIQGVPAYMEEWREELLLEGLVEQFKENKSKLKLDLQENLAQSLARAASIKAGKKLSLQEMRRLIDELFACTNPHKSPSGRRTHFTLGLDELAGRFAK